MSSNSQGDYDTLLLSLKVGLESEDGVVNPHFVLLRKNKIPKHVGWREKSEYIRGHQMGIVPWSTGYTCVDGDTIDDPVAWQEQFRPGYAVESSPGKWHFYYQDDQPRANRRFYLEEYGIGGDIRGANGQVRIIDEEALLRGLEHPHPDAVPFSALPDFYTQAAVPKDPSIGSGKRYSKEECIKGGKNSGKARRWNTRWADRLAWCHRYCSGMTVQACADADLDQRTKQALSYVLKRDKDEEPEAKYHDHACAKYQAQLPGYLNSLTMVKDEDQTDLSNEAMLEGEEEGDPEGREEGRGCEGENLSSPRLVSIVPDFFPTSSNLVDNHSSLPSDDSLLEISHSVCVDSLSSLATRPLSRTAKPLTPSPVKALECATLFEVDWLQAVNLRLTSPKAFLASPSGKT